MEQRFIKISKAAIKGGVQVGAVAGIYSGTQLYLQMQTGKRTVLNGVAAGSLSACSLGLTCRLIPRCLYFSLFLI